MSSFFRATVTAAVVPALFIGLASCATESTTAVDNGKKPTPPPAPAAKVVVDSAGIAKANGAYYTLATGNTMTFHATVLDSAGRVTQRPVTWTVTETTVVRATPNGLLTPVKRGYAQLVARADSVWAVVWLNVKLPRQVASSLVIPTSMDHPPCVRPGRPLQINWTALDDWGDTVKRTPAFGLQAGYGNDTSLIRVSASGLITAMPEIANYVLGGAPSDAFPSVTLNLDSAKGLFSPLVRRRATHAVLGGTTQRSEYYLVAPGGTVQPRLSTFDDAGHSAGCDTVTFTFPDTNGIAPQNRWIVGKSIGSYPFVANFDSLSDSGRVVVMHPDSATRVQVKLNPLSSVARVVGGTTRLLANAYNASGTLIKANVITWAPRDPAVVAIVPGSVSFDATTGTSSATVQLLGAGVGVALAESNGVSGGQIFFVSASPTASVPTGTNPGATTETGGAVPGTPTGCRPTAKAVTADILGGKAYTVDVINGCNRTLSVVLCIEQGASGYYRWYPWTDKYLAPGETLHGFSYLTSKPTGRYSLAWGTPESKVPFCSMVMNP